MQSIPEVKFPNLHQKSFEFTIASNRKILLSNLPGSPNLFRPHRIRFYSILFITEGEGHHFIDFKKYPYKKGSIIFISKEQVHAFQKNLKREASFLLFTEKFLEKSSLGSNLMQELSLYNYQLYNPVLQLEKEQMKVFSELVNRIQKEYDAPDDFATEEIIQSSLKIFLCLAERIRKTNLSSQTQSFYYEEFLLFQNLLKKNLLQTRQVKFYADQMAISTKKLNMITQEIVQKPAKNYISELLILEIKRFLTSTALSIKEISYNSGFEEPTNFVKFFKKQTNLTPAAFRKNFQQESQFQ